MNAKTAKLLRKVARAVTGVNTITRYRDQKHPDKFVSVITFETQADGTVLEVEKEVPVTRITRRVRQDCLRGFYRQIKKQQRESK